MNEETKNFVNDDEIRSLCEQLTKNHKLVSGKPFSDNYLKAIGLIIVNFQRLDFFMDGLIGILLNLGFHKKKVQIITSGLSFKNKVQMLFALTKETDFPLTSELILVLTKISKTEELRNQIIHSLWFYDKRFKITIKDTKKGLVHKSESYTSEELLQIAEMIKITTLTLDAITWNYLEHISKPE